MAKKIGKITHYYNRIGVAVLALDEELKLGDKVTILGRTTEFTQTVNSMELDHKLIRTAGPGMEVALKVIERTRVGDEIYLETE